MCFHPDMHPSYVPPFYPPTSRAEDEESYREKCLLTTPNDLHLSPNPFLASPSLLFLTPPKTLLAGTAGPPCALFPLLQPTSPP